MSSVRPRRVVARYLEASALSESAFWDIVEKFGWGSKVKYRSDGKINLKRLLPREQTDQFKKMTEMLMGKLGKQLKGVIDIPARDMEDLLGVIVGLGKRTYNAVMANPELALEIAASHKGLQGLQSAIPDDDDWVVPYAH